MTPPLVLRCCLAAAIAALASLAHAQTVDPAMKRYALKTVAIEYPAEARERHIEGRGVLAGDVHFESGRVTSVRMEKSTGSKVLDDAAIRSFRQWQFKPRLIRKFRTPITYKMANHI